MAENDTQQNSTETQQQFAIQKIYTKDISFESPNSPSIFAEQFQPQVSLELNTNGQGIAEDVYEVVLALTITVKHQDKTAYLIEIQQSGIFTVKGFDENELGHMLGSFCPNILFPYAREAVSDLATRGGFPQLLLAPVNFDALYAQHLAEQQKATKETESH